jgi:serine/threonine protein phosphatase 1
MKRFVIGDIHGAYRALLQCFERSGFDRHSDLLISLGDLCDGWPDVAQVFDELLEIRNLVLLLGNHDKWLLNYFLSGETPDIWLMQGGDTTIRSFYHQVNPSHEELLKRAKLYYVLDNNLFVHGGMVPDVPLENQDEQVFLWDRSLVKYALYCRKQGIEGRLTNYERVYVGHTPTINFNSIKPINACEVCLMDTGAGWPGGVLTMMDIDTGNLFTSEVVSELYEDARGRM